MTRRLSYRISLIMALAVSAVAWQGCGGGGSNNNTPSSGSSSGSAISVTVNPSSATVPPGATAQFNATVTGTSNTNVTWNVNGAAGGDSTNGTITAGGLYTAPTTPPSPSTVRVNAVSQADTSKFGTATVLVETHHINQDPQAFPISLGTGGGNARDSSTETVNRQTNIVCCSGTLGALVSRGGAFYVLSNNHVLDRSNEGAVGDPISQPGLADNNCRIGNTVAAETQAVTLNALNADKTGASSLADAAIAKIIDGAVDLKGSILDLGGPGLAVPPSATVADPLSSLKKGVAKSGDATGLTCSVVNSVDTSVQVDYCKKCSSPPCQPADSFTARFDHQITVTGSSFSANGDSGSLIVTQDTARPVGLLYAGSLTGPTVANPIADVLAALKDPNTGEVPTMVGGPDHAISCPASAQNQVGTAATTANLGPENLADSEVRRATSARALHSAQLMRDASISRIDIGASADAPNEAALVIHAAAKPQQQIPNVLEGVRTRIVLDSRRSSELEPISGTELVKGQVAKTRHADELMSNPAIIGVGVGASNDAPGQSAIVVYVEQGKNATVPAEIDGVRTRVIFTDRFRTFAWGKSTNPACSSKAMPLVKRPLSRLNAFGR